MSWKPLAGLVLLTTLLAPALLPAAEREHALLTDFTGQVYAENELQGAELRIAVDYQHQYFYFIADLSLLSDRKYASSQRDAWGGLYTMINRGGIGFEVGEKEAAGRLGLRAGRLPFDDVVDSPYSLFVSGQEYPPLLGELSYEHSIFFYQSRGMVLNYNSVEGYPERGANLKTFGIHLENGLRFGVQEAAVYTDIPFDPEYFISPIPQFFTQYINKSSGKPWGQTGNDNYIVGFYGDYQSLPWQISGQLLVDDFGSVTNNPDKIAWQAGARRATPWGRFGLHHGGATKYTFQAYGSGGGDTQYEYTYYPASVFTLDGEEVSIDPDENYIGYRHGENNLAFLLDYANEFAGIEAAAALEYVVTGEQSPSNPWFEYDSWYDIPGPSTKLLDSGVLEHDLRLSISGRRRFGPWTLTASAMGGYLWNAAARVDETDGAYFVPQAGNHRPLYSLSIGVTYTLGLN
jgi:hypothetical protein